MDADSLSLSATDAIAANLGCILSVLKRTCAVAESCTGGLIGGAITAIAGSSAWFGGGVIAYSNEVKMHLLGVPATVLAQHGAVSGETVIAMAAGAAKLLDAYCAVAVSGIAGPDGGSADKPVGLVFIGTWVSGTIATFSHVFPGDRASVREATVRAALQYLIDQLSLYGTHR